LAFLTRYTKNDLPHPMDRIKDLILRMLREELTVSESAELEVWAAARPENRVLLAELQDPVMMSVALGKLDRLHREEA
jgi:hypothetical protein